MEKGKTANLKNLSLVFPDSESQDVQQLIRESEAVKLLLDVVEDLEKPQFLLYTTT